MAVVKAPCKDCEKRHPCCHSSCELYKAFKNEVAKQKVVAHQISERYNDMHFTKAYRGY